MLESPVENRADLVFVELTAYLCLRLFKNYGTCIQLNLNEANYADIVQVNLLDYLIFETSYICILCEFRVFSFES